MNGQIVEGCLVIDDEKIVGISKEAHLPPADHTIRLKGRIVMAGGIDVHPHIFDPEFMGNREDFDSGTLAAAMGGLTSTIEMPTWTPCLSRKRMEFKVKEGQKRSYIDFGLHSGNARTLDDLHDIDELLSMGICSFKAFTCAPYLADDFTLLSLLRMLGRRGILMVHSENEAIVDNETKKLRNQGRTDPLAFHESRPNIAEEEAISRISIFAKRSTSRVHIVHMSTAGGKQVVEEAKKRGIDISAETCPHYLVYTKNDGQRLGPYLKMSPPARNAEDREALWLGLKDGTIDMVASDHYPTFKEAREKGWSDIWEVLSGLPGVETMLPVLISEGFNKGRLNLADVSRVMSENPAKRFGLHPNKGTIRIGAHADLVAVDVDKEWQIRSDKLHQRSDWTPFEGFNVKGSIEMTMVRGHIIMMEGEIHGKPGFGKFLPRHLEAAA
jgi:dihydroorotase (multifunctional complex type)